MLSILDFWEWLLKFFRELWGPTVRFAAFLEVCQAYMHDSLPSGPGPEHGPMLHYAAAILLLILAELIYLRKGQYEKKIA